MKIDTRSSGIDNRPSLLHHRLPSPVRDLCPSESAAAATAAMAPARSSLATLLASHILRDGELVLLILRPSFWFIPLSSLRFIAAVLIVAIAGRLWGPMVSDRVYYDVAAVVIVARLMFATLTWMSRLYVLTDMRILRLSGIFAVEVFDCPLRRVARTRLVYTVRERLLGLGSIEITPADPAIRPVSWAMVARPVQVHETVLAAITRAKQNGLSR